MKKFGIFFKKYGSTILTGLGVGGVVATAFVAIFDAKREDDIFSEAELKEIERLRESEGLHGQEIKLSKKEAIKCYIKTYWHTALAVTATSACIIFSKTWDAKKIAALTAAATFTEEKFRKYREIVKEKLGEDEEHNIYAEIAEKEWHMSPPLPEGEGYSDADTMFYDSFSERYFKCSEERFTQALYHLNRQFHLKGYVFLSEFYEFLGLTPTDLHKTIGWSDSYYLEEWGLIPWIDIYTQEKTAKNGVKYYAIYYDLEPSVKALKDWM